MSSATREAILHNRVIQLETREERHRQTIRNQSAEIKRLQNALRLFLDRNHGDNGSPSNTDPESPEKEAIDDVMSDGDDADDEEEGEDVGEDEDASLPDALWDDSDQVERCTECIWEVTDGFCTWCGTEYNLQNGYIGESNLSSVTTDDEAIKSERYLAPRGDTPLLELGPIYSAPEHLSLDTYMALLERGASRLMCEAFHLEFSYAEGIVAWADDDIFDEYAGPGMAQGDCWKIHLGRCVQLGDDDPDGAQFVDELLEEVLSCPAHSTSSMGVHECWETVREGPGVWVTRPMGKRPEEGTSDAMIQPEGAALEDTGNDQAHAELVIRVDEYAVTEADEASDIDMDSDHPQDWCTDPRRPDGDFGVPEDQEDEEDEDELEYAEDDVNIEQGTLEVTIASEDEIDESECDSDFDSDEVLSGDEYVMSVRNNIIVSRI